VPEPPAGEGDGCVPPDPLGEVGRGAGEVVRSRARMCSLR